MKKKHYSFILIIIVATSVISIFIYGAYALLIDDNSTSSRLRFRHVVNNTIIDMNILDEIKRMKSGIKKIKNYKPDNIEDQSLVNIFGHGATNKNSKDVNKNEGTEKFSFASDINYKLSFIMISKDRKYCILDGKLYIEKAKLNDGGIVEQIENDRVLIKKFGVEKWLEINISDHLTKPDESLNNNQNKIQSNNQYEKIDDIQNKINDIQNLQNSLIK